MAIMAEKDVINVSDIPVQYNPNFERGLGTVESRLFAIDNLKDAKKTFEREFIQRRLSQNNNNITKTAKSIGVENSYLSKKLKSII